MMHLKVPICVKIQLADAKTATALWNRLRYEHYLSSHVSLDCAAFSIHLKSPQLPQLSHPVGLIIVNCVPGWKTLPGRTNVRYVHRLVLDPPVQGVKIGSVAIDLLGAVLANRKLTLKCITSHEAMISHLERSNRWTFVKAKSTKKRFAKDPDVTSRHVKSFSYTGPSHKVAPKSGEVACSSCPRTESFSASVTYSL